MKKLCWVILPLFIISFSAAADPGDTIIRGILVSFRYSPSIFPESWRVAPINASADPLEPDEIDRCKFIVKKALNKYPEPALKKELKEVYFLKEMSFYDVGYGGTNSSNALYLTDDGEAFGYTDLYLEQTFHHEFSSIIFRNHPKWLNEKAWLAANMEGVDYNDPENGVGAIRNNQSSQELDTALCREGFLTQYALSGLENDLNTFAQNLFSPSAGFWKLVDKYPRIKKKTLLLIAFYNKMSPLFTEKYFRKLK